jgi:glucan phosphoethanolaminetransferase (alkaline phosphatase superfamily)
VKAISQFVVHVFDLIEAEGATILAVVRGEARRVHAAATNMALGVAILLISVPLFIAGFGLLAAGLMWWLETQVSRPLAAGLTGFVILALAAGCLACFKMLTGRRQP